MDFQAACPGPGGECMKFGLPQRVCMVAVVAVIAAFAAGCRTSTRSGLPEHIRTVEVHMFKNKTMYKGIEGTLTRRLIDRINGDPTIKAVSRGGDAVITGEITAVRRRTLRETTTNEPGTVLITIEATYSFFDERSGRHILRDATISSDATGIISGVFEASRGGRSEDGEQGAAMSLADEIARRTIGMW